MRKAYALLLTFGLGVTLASTPSCSTSEFASGTPGTKSTAKKKKNTAKDETSSDPQDYLPENAANGDGDNPAGEIDSDDSSVANDDGSIRQTFSGEAATEKIPVDIVFAVDTSGSMSQEKARLQTEMAVFITAFETKAKNTDYQIYMIGRGFTFPAGTDGKITKIDTSVGSNNALTILKMFFTNKIANPKPLRVDAKKQLVVVSDDNAKDEIASTFKTFIQTTDLLKDKTSVNGFVGLTTSVNTSTCKIARIGTEYTTLGADPEVGGLIQDLCQDDWNKLLDDLATKIIKENRRGDFPLSQPVDTDHTITATVDGVAVDKADFSYVPASNTIVFAKDAKPADGVPIVIVYWPK